MRHERFRLLFVCTANICRSPMAAELTRLTVTATRSGDDDMAVCSAGTRGLDGSRMDPGAAAVLHSLGGRTDGFLARTVTVAMIVAADLILTAERRHRADTVCLHPRSHGKVFTILEFARLVHHVDPDGLPEGNVASRARALVGEAARMRGICPPAPCDEDIADPSGGTDEDYRGCAAMIQNALTPPLRRILCDTN